MVRIKAMGKTVRYQDKKDLQVTAVFKNVGPTYSRKFDYLINWDTYLGEHPGVGSWQNTGPMTLLLLKAGADPAVVGRKLMHFMGKFVTENDQYRVESRLQRYDDVYLHSTFVDGIPVGGRIAYVHLFSIVAVFILLMACVNFMNLTTARSVRRAREIGVRKVMGAARLALVRQFIGESLLLTVLAVVVSLLLMSMVLPVFNFLTQKELTRAFWGCRFLVADCGVDCCDGVRGRELSCVVPVGLQAGGCVEGDGSDWDGCGLVSEGIGRFSICVIGGIDHCNDRRIEASQLYPTDGPGV